MGGGFSTPSAINAEVVETFLRDFAAKENLGPRTYNHYLQAAQEFTKWLFRTGRASTNPLLSLEPLNCEVDIRHKRRALSAEDVVKLVQSARDSGEKIQCFDGETRARIYLLSYMTGLRKKELASLTPKSFSLASAPPTVTVKAADSKNRKPSKLPLHPELVAMLCEWLKGVPDDEFLFPDLDRRRGYLMVKKDLERVGIPYKNADGVADFHAAGCHTHITELLRNGASLPEARELARHSDVRQTMKYTHIGIDDQAKAIRRLPWHQIGTNPGILTVPSSPLVTPPKNAPQRQVPTTTELLSRPDSCSQRLATVAGSSWSHSIPAASTHRVLQPVQRQCTCLQNAGFSCAAAMGQPLAYRSSLVATPATSFLTRSTDFSRRGWRSGRSLFNLTGLQKRSRL
jgi:integrase